MTVEIGTEAAQFHYLEIHKFDFRYSARYNVRNLLWVDRWAEPQLHYWCEEYGEDSTILPIVSRLIRDGYRQYTVIPPLRDGYRHTVLVVPRLRDGYRQYTVIPHFKDGYRHTVLVVPRLRDGYRLTVVPRPRDGYRHTVFLV